MDIVYRGVRGPRARAAVLVSCALGAVPLNCARKSDPKPTLAAPARALSAKTPVPAPSTTGARPVPRPLHPAEQFVFAWSAVLNRRAADELGPFYGARVLFYGQRKSAREVLVAKRLS